jgi:hypothetical protein
MLGRLQGAGDVVVEPDGRTFTVTIRREARYTDLRKQLTVWETYGFLKWELLA